MKNFKSLLLLLFFLSLFGCTKEEKNSLISVFSGIEMTIPYNIVVGTSLTSSQRKSIEEIIKSTFAEVDAIYNKWNPHSELSRLNLLQAYQKVTLSAQLYHLFQITDNIVTLSEGRFDPTIEPIQRLWKQYLEKGSIPSQTEIENLASVIGWKKIHFENGVFYKEDSRISLDFGGIAKGLCIDLLVERLTAAGFPNLLVEWVGEIRATGQHPEQRPWHIGIKGLEQVDLGNNAIATSGDYLQNWPIHQEGRLKIYFHIIDPFNLQPLEIHRESIASASVIASSCAFADGIASTLMLFKNTAEAKIWGEKIQSLYPELQFWVVSRNLSEK